MKIEIDVDSNQLQLLDTSLKEFLLSLNDEQKIKLIENYIFLKFDNVFYKDEVSLYSNSRKLSDFGNSLIDGLQEKINKSITNKIMENSEIQNLINNSIDETEKNMNTIISNAITTYIINNLFCKPEKLKDNILMNTQTMINDMIHYRLQGR